MNIREGAVRELLRGTSLRIEEFALEYFGDDEIPGGSEGTRIDFLLNPAFFFEAIRVEDGCGINLAPGHLTIEENRFLPENDPRKPDLIDRLRSELQQWLRRVDSELRDTAAQRLRSAAEEAVSDLLDDIEETEEFFTREEAQVLNERLDELEARMNDLIRENSPDEETANERMEAVHRDIEHLRRRSEQVNKTAWFRSAAQVAGVWLAQPESRKLIEGGVEAIRTLLLPGG